MAQSLEGYAALVLPTALAGSRTGRDILNFFSIVRQPISWQN